MNYQEIKQDLFKVDESYALAHCISQDYKMGAGIALAFVKNFPDMKGKISQQEVSIGQVAPYYTGTRYILNMVTKAKYWNKPTPLTFEDAIISLRKTCDLYGIKKVAMPKVGAGLDRLDWEDNRTIIQRVFKDTDVEILICYQ